MHKRADTIGCVWLAYCISSLYSYFCGRSRICTLNCKLSTILARLCDRSMSESSALPCVFLFRHRPYFAPCKSKFRPARYFSSFRAANQQLKKGGVKMKNIILPYIVYHVYFCLSSSRAITVHILLPFLNSHS